MGKDAGNDFQSAGLPAEYRGIPELVGVDAIVFFLPATEPAADVDGPNVMGLHWV